MSHTVAHLLADRVASDGFKTFAVDPSNGSALSFTELQQKASSIASLIESQGVKPGESVAFAMHNSIDCAVVLLGIMVGGFRATAINLVSGPSTIRYVMQHSEAALIFTDEKQTSLLKSVFEEGATSPPQLLVDDAFWKKLSDFELNRAQVAAYLNNSHPEDDALLMYTSGTTGVPKGVVLSHRSLIAGGENTCQAHKLQATDRALCVLPLYHINGLCVTLMGPLVSGGSVVLPEKFSVKRFWPWVAESGCTWFSVVPTQISYLLHDTDQSDELDLTAIRFGRSASAPLSPDVQRAFEERFKIPIVETMGLTETAAQILSNPLPPGVRKIGSPGVAIGNDVRIADDNQQAVAPGVEGEVLVRGPNVMSRYLKNEEVTRKTITADGWLRTGDLGRKDEEGYVYITGRLKELIIKGGENVAPREVDEALYSHPSVIEAAAFAQPCRQYGQRIEAAVSLQTDSNVNEEDLLELCRNTLGKFKSPDRIYFLEELPKGPSGKIQRLKLCEMFTE